MTETKTALVAFHGHDILTINDGETIRVAMKPICEAIGLQWEAQLKRIKRHDVMAACMSIMDFQMPGDDQRREVATLPLDMLNGWLFGVEASRVKPEIRERLVEYQRECFGVLHDYWTKGQATNPRPYSTNPGDALTAEQANTLRNMLTEAAQAMPKDLQGLVIREGWSKLKAHFKCGYRQIPQSEFTEAVSLLNRHIVYWKRTKVTDAAVSPAPTFVPQCDLPPTVQAALDCKAWELAAQAHKIIHQHLSISVDISCAIGHPARFIHETDALATIAKTTLDSAFTPSGTSLDAILRYAEGTAEVAKEYAERIKLGVQALRGTALLGPVLKAGKMAALA